MIQWCAKAIRAESCKMKCLALEEKFKGEIKMEEFLEYARPLLGLLLCMCIFMWVLTWTLYKWDVCFTEANIVDVYVGDKKVYEGKQAFIKVESGGMTTHLTIYKNLYPEIVDRLYSSNDIKIIPYQYKARIR